jgi:hypothetical protein
MWKTNRIAICVVGTALYGGFGPAATLAQTAPEPELSEPAPAEPVCYKTGKIHRMLHRSAHVLQDKMIGYPETFIEPPLGTYVNEQFAMHVARADTHRFTLYKTDFLPGTNQLSPTGASRFNIMAKRLPGSLMPVMIEWTPDQPGLAESRRLAVLSALNQVGRPIVPERVLIGPSPYPGAMGIEASNNFSNTLVRTQTAASNFPLSPTESSSSGVR